jgi:hypothetical protein
MELQLQIVGGILMVLALVHVIFPRYFNWKEELVGLQLVNRQIMEVHTFFIALAVGLIGLLCLSSAHELVTSTLGRRVAGGLAVFWGLRWYFQFFVYSSKLWKGKPFETTVHVAFSLLWTYLTVLFVLVAMG